MTEPSRIGLTASVGAQLEELLEELNPEQGSEGLKLIKFDLYRLAVAFGLNKAEQPPPLKERGTASFRVSELDPDGVLYLAAESSKLLPSDTPIYEFIERLAESEISEFYRIYQKTGNLPLDQYFEE